MTVVNYTEFFKSERDIYVQNVSNCQVSVMFEVGPGHTESYLFINSPDPINLTQKIPFAAIKASMDFRKMLNRQPVTLKLLTEDQFREHYSRAAQRKGLATAEEAMEAAERTRVEIQNHVLDKPAELLKERGEGVSKEEIQAEEDDKITPRVLNLCLQVHPSLSNEQRLSAQDFMTELDAIGNLTAADWSYIRDNGYYKSIKNMAKKKFAELSSEDDDEPVADTKKKSKK